MRERRRGPRRSTTIRAARPRRLAERAAIEIEAVVGDIRTPRWSRAAVRGMDCVCHLAYVNGTEFFYTKPGTDPGGGDQGDDERPRRLPRGRRARAGARLELGGLPDAADRFRPTRSAPLSIPDVLNPRFSYGGGQDRQRAARGELRPEALRPRPHLSGHTTSTARTWASEHVIPQFVAADEGARRGAAGRRASIFRSREPGEETRSFIYIDDFVDGLLCVIEQGDRARHLSRRHRARDVDPRARRSSSAAACGRDDPHRARRAARAAARRAAARMFAS